jgi:DNA adenine methylase
MNANVSEWLGAVEGLPEVHARLRRVLVESRPALELIRAEDGTGTLFYLDPPYLPSTRGTQGAYAFDMTEEDHRDLLAAIRGVKGKVMLSGYPSALYDEALAGWTRHAFDVPNHVSGGARKRRETECLWCNF